MSFNVTDTIYDATNSDRDDYYYSPLTSPYYGNNEDIPVDDNESSSSPGYNDLIFWLWLFMLLCLVYRDSLRRNNWVIEIDRVGNDEHDDETEQQQIKREQRQKLVASSLITKRVVGRDFSGCQLTLGEYNTTTTTQSQQPATKDIRTFDDYHNVVDSSSGNHQIEEGECCYIGDNDEEFVDIELDEDDEHSDECVICLEKFQIGDDVSFSNKGEDCLHVFHSRCIKAWLQDSTHNECPSCRCIIITEKEESSTRNIASREVGHDDDEIDLELGSIIETGNHINNNNSNTHHTGNGVFVIMNGLISQVQRRLSRRYSQLSSSVSYYDNIDDCHQLAQQQL